MTVTQALEYIHSVSWMGSRPGLSRITELLDRMENPHKKCKFIHVAGTNGKGSVSAMTASVLRSAGYKTGLFTSPYILRFNERMSVDGVDISDELLADITEYVKPFAEAMEDHPTEFELVTAIGFEYFARQNCDIVVLEVGLGGELDSTNVIDAPLLALITEIDFDHMGVLGDTIEEIAAAKAGIIKSGTTVISANNLPESANVIKAACCNKYCRCLTPEYEKQADKRITDNGIAFAYKGVEYTVPLMGDYQFRNALMAVTAAYCLRDMGYDISEDDMVRGLETVRWRGRFELLNKRPAFIYDGGHNPQGVTAAVSSYLARYGDQKAVVLIGVMADKDYGREIRMLAPLAKCFVTVTPNNPRALDSVALAEQIGVLGVKAFAAERVEQGVSLAATLADEGTPIFALGSLYMYGEICAAVEKLFSQKQSNFCSI